MRLLCGKHIYLIGVPLLLIVFGFLTGLIPRVAYIRIDCGDIRYSYMGIPLYIDRLPKSTRDPLLVLAGQSGISARWAYVAPSGFSYDTLGGYRNCYYLLANWARVDQNIGRLLLQDMSSHINAANGAHSTWEGMQVLYLDAFNPDGPAGSLNDPTVVAYCEKRGYTRPEWIGRNTTQPGK
jgi:hypothetical protein